MYLAHRTEDGREQSILEHSKNVAALCAAFAGAFGAEELGWLAGLLHDIGKYSDAFQQRIRGAAVQTDHSTAGAQEIFNYLGWIGAYCVAGHHGGLPNGGGQFDAADSPTLSGRLKRPVEPYGRFAQELCPKRVRPERTPKVLGQGGFTMAFWIRMLYSCLVDADFLDTEEFMRGSPPPRGSSQTMEQLLDRLEQYIAKWEHPESELNRARCDILQACMDAGKNQKPGLFTLTVPTGGGKTVSSLAFALRHAVCHGKKRIIYVIPYTSIIEQTADAFRTILGSEAVLEHHANVDFGDDENGLPDPEKIRKKLAAENWDLPVVVTTAVQFFESLFASRPSRCRKLHNLADSVIIFDEAQTLPLPYLLPCVRAIGELTVNYGASCVLCTATQPALGSLFTDITPELTPREIAPEIPEQVFRRVCYENLGSLPEEDLALRLNEQHQALCIVGTRKQARALYDLLEPEGRFHLSTLMYPEHRRKILKTIKKRLKQGLPCRVASTSLIEAGVDVDFPTVFREEAGLDSIVQAAGRCNREGKRTADKSRVYIFRPMKGSTLPHELQRPLEVMRAILRNGRTPADPGVIEDYFTALCQFTGKGIDKSNLVARFEAGMQDPERPSFPFAEAAEDFHLIEQNTRTVVIPQTREAQALAARLERGERNRDLLRKAGQYAVNIYEQQFDALRSLGCLTVLEEGLAVLTDRSRYSEETGLAVPADSGEGIFL